MDAHHDECYTKMQAASTPEQMQATRAECKGKREAMRKDMKAQHEAKKAEWKAKRESMKKAPAAE
jgi:hypothetical protein